MRDLKKLPAGSFIPVSKEFPTQLLLDALMLEEVTLVNQHLFYRTGVRPDGTKVYSPTIEEIIVYQHGHKGWGYTRWSAASWLGLPTESKNETFVSHTLPIADHPRLYLTLNRNPLRQVLNVAEVTVLELAPSIAQYVSDPNAVELYRNAVTSLVLSKDISFGKMNSVIEEEPQQTRQAWRALFSA